ncbi:uncharacterized protein C8orf88 homolog [Porphyrio hochstetteri]
MAILLTVLGSRTFTSPAKNGSGESHGIPTGDRRRPPFGYNRHLHPPAGRPLNGRRHAAVAGAVVRRPVPPATERNWGPEAFCFKMFKETKKFIGKSLQPARPVHHLSSKQVCLNTCFLFSSLTSAIELSFETELPGNTEVCLQSNTDQLSEMTEVKILTQAVMPCQPKQHASEEKKERIKYSRDFLLQLSSVSVSKKKPEFLPDHPIVLKNPEKSNPFIAMCKK